VCWGPFLAVLRCLSLCLSVGLGLIVDVYLGSSFFYVGRSGGKKVAGHTEPVTSRSVVGLCCARSCGHVVLGVGVVVVFLRLGPSIRRAARARSRCREGGGDPVGVR